MTHMPQANAAGFRLHSQYSLVCPSSDRLSRISGVSGTFAPNICGEFGGVSILETSCSGVPDGGAGRYEGHSDNQED
jgi:hypothetical protein